MKKYLGLMVRASFILVYALSFVFPTQSVAAAASLQLTPITWNVVGLDSNNVNVGPNNFPVGVRACNPAGNAVTFTDVEADFVWQAGGTQNDNSLIRLRPGSLDPIAPTTPINLAPGACYDFYFEVEIERSASAYDQTRRYVINVTYDDPDFPGIESVSTPTPREIFVERLISQSRNSTTNVLLNGNPIAPGGVMTLMVGNTYNITLIGSTATNGYEQLETFVNIPNTVFQVNSVTTTFTANGGTDPLAPSKLYANGCNWENNPNSPNYRSCLSTGKYGGNINVIYNVTIIGGSGTSQVLNTLIYDFSGSSYHYNADFAVNGRIANIVSPATISKSFSPSTISAGGTSTLTFTIKNNSPSPLSDLNFSDSTNWPAGVSVQGNQTISYSGCGSPTPSSVSNGATSLSVSNVSLAANGTCTFGITVTAAVDGVYPNTTNNLFIGSSDTHNKASSTLVVSSMQPVSSYSCGAASVPLVTWSFGTAAVPTLTPTYNVSGITATASGTAVSPGTFTLDTATGSPAASSYRGTNWSTTGGTTTVPYPPNPATYFQFNINTANYIGLAISFNYLAPNGTWGGNQNNYFYVYTDTSPSGAFTFPSGSGAAYNFTKSNSWQTGPTAPASTTGAGTTRFFITAYGASSAATTLNLDNVVISGCPRPTPPTLAKSFSPATIALDSSVPPAATTNYSTLTFTIGNTNASALTGVSFTDTLPDGLVVANPPTVSAFSCNSGTMTGAVTAVAGTNTISLSNGNLPAGATTSCTFSVRVQGLTAGAYTNITNRIQANVSGANTSGGANVGFGQANLTVIDPPVINKSFTANPIFTGNTTTLNFTITNPNASTTLNGISFTDTLPSGLTVASPNGLSGSCGGGTITAVANSSSVSLSGASLTSGQTCSFSVNVVGVTTGLKNNSVTVSSTNGGTGNISTASVLVKDPAPAISILKSVGPSNVGPWTPSLSVTLPGSVYYRFIVENIGDVPLNNVNISDPNVNISGCSWVDGDGTGLTAPFTLPVADANDNQLAICILGPITALDGSNPNTATASGTNGITVTDTSTATYTGVAPNLVLAKTDGVTSVIAGGTTSYTLTVTNNGNAPTSGLVTVVDVPPVGLAVTAISGSGWTCTLATLTCTRSDALAAGNSYPVITVDATVSTSASGTLVNKAKVGGGGDPTNSTTPDATTVAACNANGTPEGCAIDSNELNSIAIDKDTSTPSVVVGGSANYSIVITNTGTTPLTGAVVSDVLPTGFTYASTGTIVTTGAGTTRTSTSTPNVGDTSLSWGAWTIVPGGSVTIPFTVNIGLAVTPGTYDNTASVITTEITTPVDDDGTAAQDPGTPPGLDPEDDEDVTVSALVAPSVTKDFAAANIALGGTTTLTVTLGNSNLVAVTLTANLTDTLPTGMTINTAGHTGTCTGVTAAGGAGSFTVASGTSIPAGGCTVIVEVTSSTAGAAVNTIAAGALQTNAGNNASPATDTVNVYAPPTVTKSFSPSSIAAGGTSTLTIVVTNPAGNPGNLTGVSVGDTYTGTLVNNAAGSVSCDTGSSATLTGGVNGGTSVGFNNGTLEPGDSCTITQSVTATSTNNNTTTAPAATGPVALTGTPASDTLTVSALVAPSISKAFSLNPIDVNTVSTLTFTITNPNPGVALTGVAFTDTFPAGMEVAVTPNESVTGCGAPTFVPTAGNTSLSFSGGTIAASGTCTVTVDVTATTGGSKVNTTGNVTSTNGGTGNTGTDTLQVNVPVDLQVTKDDGVTSFIAGDTLTYTIKVWNTGPNDIVGATLSDPRPADISSWSWTCTATGAGSSCGTPANGTADISVTGINLPADPGGLTNFLTYTVTATVSGTPGNTLTNTVTVTEPAGTVDTNPANNIADDTNGQIFDPPSAFKTFNAAGLPVIEFRMVWINNGNAAAIDVQVTDTIPVGTTYVPGSVTCTPLNASITAAAATAPLNTNAAQVTPSTSCGYDSVANGIQWQGTIAPDPGVANDANAEANAVNEVIITFQVTVDANTNTVSNVGTSRTDADANGDFTSQADILGTTIANSNLVIWNRGAAGGGGGGGGGTVSTAAGPVVLPTVLPATGFAPNKVTILPEQPAEKAYSTTSDVWLEIPRLGLKMPIVGVPLYENDWDVSWLWREAGWLQGTAFPGWQGNSVLTSHITLPNGEAGPFAALDKLKWGDRILVHAYGTVYIYEVRQNRTVKPTDVSALQHEDDSWLTLLTCKTYIESTNTYANRVAVRAVLIGTTVEKTTGEKNIR